MRPKVGGAWRYAYSLLTKVSGTWRTVNYQYVKVGGAWKRTYSNFPMMTTTIGIEYKNFLGEDVYGYNYSDLVPALCWGTASNINSSRGRLYKCSVSPVINPKILNIILGGVHSNTVGLNVSYGGLLGSVSSVVIEGAGGAIAEVFSRIAVTFSQNLPTSGNRVLLIGQ